MIKPSLDPLGQCFPFKYGLGRAFDELCNNAWTGATDNWLDSFDVN